MMSRKLVGNLAMLLCATLFGINIPISKTVVGDWVNPLGLTFMRMAFAACAFWFVSVFIPHQRIEKGDWWKLMVGAFLGMFFNQLCFLKGLSMTSPVDASIIATTTPVITMLVAALFLSEPITMKKAGGVLLGAAGALTVIFGSKVVGQESSLWGNVWCVVSSLSYASYLIFSMSFVKKYHPVILLRWLFLFSSIYSIPFTYEELVSSQIFHQPLPFSAYAHVFFCLFGATFITYLLIPIAQKRIRPTTISSYNYVQPLVASIIAILIGQDVLAWEKVVAGGLIMSGVYLVTTSKSKADIEREKLKKSE